MTPTPPQANNPPILPAHLLPDPEVQPTVPVWPTAGKALGLGRTASFAAAKRGEIPTIRVGGRLVVPTAALRRILFLDHDADRRAA
jgi:hypothetical protein